MNTKYIATLAAMLAVPALVVSCNGQNYSTPDGVVQGEIQVLKDFAAAADACNKDDTTAFETAVKAVTELQKRINQGLEAMTPEQKAEIKKLIEEKYAKEIEEASGAMETAMGKLAETLGVGGIEKVQPVLDEFENALAPVFAME